MGVNMLLIYSPDSSNNQQRATGWELGIRSVWEIEIWKSVFLEGTSYSQLIQTDSQTDRQTDRWKYDANSRSYCHI